jgi:hypothetical protein
VDEQRLEQEQDYLNTQEKHTTNLQPGFELFSLEICIDSPLHFESREGGVIGKQALLTQEGKQAKLTLNGTASWES